MKRLIYGFCTFCIVHAVWTNPVWAAQLFKKPTSVQSASIPWRNVNEHAAAIAQQMLERPTVFARGAQNTFACMPEQYYWMLENPDRVVIAWRRLGAKCVSITRRSSTRFGYTDEYGSDVSWQTIHQTPDIHIWFAEGKVKGSAAMPMVP